MESPSISHPAREPAASHGAGYNSGFTLIETLIVLSIFIVLIGVVSVVSFNSYQGYLFRSERSTMVSVFERARSRAMANYFETAHGVTYDTALHRYIIFRAPYVPGNATNEIIPGNPNSTITGLGTIIFDQLTGKPNPLSSGASTGCLTDEKSIRIIESNKDSYVCINNEGRINW